MKGFHIVAKLLLGKLSQHIFQVVHRDFDPVSNVTSRIQNIITFTLNLVILYGKNWSKFAFLPYIKSSPLNHECSLFIHGGIVKI